MILPLSFSRSSHTRCRRIIFFVVALLSWHSSLAQQDARIEQGIIRIKVTESFSRQLENNGVTRTKDNSIMTGAQAFDAVNVRYSARNMKRVFRTAGKYEAKHRKYGLHLWYEIQLGMNAPVEAAIRDYRGLSFVQKAEPVYKKEIYDVAQQPRIVSTSGLKASTSDVADDPLLPQQWHYHNTGQHDGTPGADIDLYKAWSIDAGRKDVVVAIMDTGVETDHPDLAANMWVNEGEIAGNDLDDDGNGYVDDVHGYDFAMDRGIIIPGDHGTHVAGTVAGVSNNGMGVAGVAGGTGAGDGARLMSCAVFSEGPSNFASAYVYAADNGAVISQNSWGYIEPGYYDEVELEAIDYFINEAGRDEQGNQVGLMNGGLVVFAAGNTYSSGRFYPGFYEPVLAVAATGNKDIKPDYSTYGTWVDISAPGGETEIVTERGVLSTLTGGQYGFYQGTSMACPHVSGVAALVLSKLGGPGYTPRMLRQRLQVTGDYIDDLNPAYAGKMGMGRLNAYQALLENHGLPEAIDDLSIVKTEIGKITLTWTAPVDAGALKVSYYDVRYAVFPVTAENFNNATPASFPTTPQVSGKAETFTITGLASETQYFFAVRSVDFEGNVSALSNIAEAATLPAPSIQVTPVSLHAALQTNETDVHVFTIANSGRGTLNYSIATSTGAEDFLTYNITAGEIASGSSTDIAVTFSAQRLPGGSYQRDIIIRHNDPARASVLVHAILDVTNNNAPILQTDRSDLHFKSVQVGTSALQEVTVYNAGSAPLTVFDIQSAHAAFTSNSTSFTLPPFQDSVITITFAPDTPGRVESTLSIDTNDPAQPVVTIPVKGEGLTQQPVTANPSALQVSLPKGSQATETLKLTNHGSYDRSFTVEIISRGLVEPEQMEVFDQQAARDSSVSNMTASYEEMKATFALLSPEQQQLLKAITRPDASNVSVDAQPSPMEQHVTGFEDFELGPINGQYGWEADPEWIVTTGNAYEGSQYFHATSDGKGYSVYYPNLALSPIIEQEDPWQTQDYLKYSHVSMRINLDSARGVLWEVVPQNPYAGYVTARVQFTEDGKMMILSAKEEDIYDYDWQLLNEPIPSGYFTLAVERNNLERTFNIYFNDRKVFSGYSLAAPINQVALLSTMEVQGPSVAVDDFRLTFGEYIPVHIQPLLAAGTLTPNSTTTIPLLFDATNLRWGTYATDIVIHFDNGQQLTIPATLTVSGEARITLDTFLPARHVLQKGEEQYMETGRRIINDGGVPLTYEVQVQDNSGWISIENTSGVIPVRGQQILPYTVTSIGHVPGFYRDTLDIVSNAPQVLSVPVDIAILEPGSELISFPQGRITRIVKQGTISEVQFEIANGGDSTMSFLIGNYSRSPGPPPWITIDPLSGKLDRDHPQLVTVKIDATAIQTDTTINIASDLRTNDAHGNAWTGKGLFFTFHIRKALPPVLEAFDNITLREKQSQDITFTATDADSGHVTITLIDPPSFVTLKTSGNGTATYTVSPPVGTASEDEYRIEVVATDDEGATDREYLSILVEPQIVAPMLQVESYITVREKESRDITFTAVDDDSEYVTITLVNPPPFVTLTSSGDRTATYTIFPPVGAANRDEYLMEVLATDSEGNTGHAYFSMLVEPYPGFESFELRNLKDGTTLFTFENEVQLDRSWKDYNNLVIRATPLEELPGSIVFYLHGKKTTVNHAPYDLKLSRHTSLNVADYILTVEGYSRRNGKGTLLYSRKIQLSVVVSPTIPAFRLVDDVGNVIQTLQDGDVIEVGNGTHDCVRIEAVQGDYKIQQVAFDFNNGYTYTDYSAPFMSHGRNCWNPSPGEYTVYATPAWKGSMGGLSAVSFTIVENPAIAGRIRAAQGAPEQLRSEGILSFTIFPVPVQHELHVSLNGYGNRKVNLAIIGLQGNELYKQTVLAAEHEVLTVSTAGLKPGLYFIKLVDQNGSSVTRKFMKAN